MADSRNSAACADESIGIHRSNPAMDTALESLDEVIVRLKALTFALYEVAERSELNRPVPRGEAIFALLAMIDREADAVAAQNSAVWVAAGGNA